MSNPKYQQTGNSIPLKEDELINFVHNKLNEFVELSKVTKMKPDSDPSKDPIIFITHEGKTVQIPIEIQKKAIQTWIKPNDNMNNIGDGGQFDNSEHNNGGPTGNDGYFANNPNSLEGTNAEFRSLESGAPLDQTTHMGDMGNSKIVNQEFNENENISNEYRHNNMPNYIDNVNVNDNIISGQQRDDQERPARQRDAYQRHDPRDGPIHDPRYDPRYGPIHDSMHGPMYPNEKVVIVKDNSTSFYFIILLIIAATVYYYYKNIKL
jgi:hypothetical protein